MGRGGGRSKASSTATTYEAGASYIPVDLNTTLIEFIFSGHFETDYFSYCSTRLSAYTCRYWFDPNHSGDLKSSTSGTFTYPTFSRELGGIMYYHNPICNINTVLYNIIIMLLDNIVYFNISTFHK